MAYALWLLTFFPHHHHNYGRLANLKDHFWCPLFHLIKQFNWATVFYCETILIRGDQCSRIVKNVLVRWDVFSWVTGLLQYNTGQFITLLKIRRDALLWVTLNPRNPQTSATNDDDSTVSSAETPYRLVRIVEPAMN